MPAAPDCPNEENRLVAVNKLRLMGTPAEERFDRITRLARKMFDVPLAALDIVGAKLAWLKSVQGFDGIEGLRRHSYCHHTVLEDGVCLTKDARKDPRFFDSNLANTWVFYAGVPLHFEGERVGVLCIGDKITREFNEDQFGELSDLAVLAEHELEISALSEAQLALAKENAELEKKAKIDILTHIWNHGAIKNILEVELLRAAEDRMVSLLIVDIDHYKEVNDTYGHAAGDEVLREISARLRAAIRPMDAVGRYGGDEFLVVLSNARSDIFTEVAQRICDSISQKPIVFENQEIAVTCSIGGAASAQPIALKNFFEVADKHLYEAKSAGRNRIKI